MDAAVIALSLTVLATAGYLAWPSRWNVPAHMSLGFSLVAYIIPSLIGATDAFSRDLLRFDAELLGVGAACYAAGVLAGARVRLTAAPWERLQVWLTVPPRKFQDRTVRKTILLSTGGLVGLIACFYLMGYVPAFARNPILAKFFRGAYALSYAKVAAPYRLSYSVVVTMIPLCLMAWYARHSRLSLILATASILAVAATLTRGPIAAGALLALGIAAARRRTWSAAYLLFVLVAYPLGSALYKLVGIQATGLHTTLWSMIAAGAPDIPDQLGFLLRFLSHPIFTHGKTFWGGLVPWHYRWNPAVFTLNMGNQSLRINEIASGGLRLAAPQWGYIAFGWTGAVLVPLASGLIWGYATGMLRRNINKSDLLQCTVATTLYLSLWGTLSQFYVLSTYAIPPALLTIALAYTPTPPKRRARPAHEGLPLNAQVAMPPAR